MEPTTLTAIIISSAVLLAIVAVWFYRKSIFGTENICPNCGSTRVARDSASPWAFLVAFISLVPISALSAAALSPWAVVGAILFMALGVIAFLCNRNAWCRGCGVRFKRDF